MTSDRVLTLIAIVWFLLTLLYLAGAGILPAGAAPIPGGEDTPMTCGVWTYYAAGVAERAQAIHPLPGDVIVLGKARGCELAGCRIQFVPASPAQRYCSPECRREADRRRREGVG